MLALAVIIWHDMVVSTGLLLGLGAVIQSIYVFINLYARFADIKSEPVWGKGKEGRRRGGGGEDREEEVEE